MAKLFSTLKDPKLGMHDQITFGKLKGCRVCDVIQDHYEYLIWVEKEGYCKFQQIVVETIQDAANFAKWEEPKEDKVVDTYDKFTRYDDFWYDDIPF